MENDSGTPSNRFIVLVVTITNAGLIIVDRSLRQASIKFFLPTSSLADIHFQYNGFLLGILVLSVYFIVKVIRCPIGDVTTCNVWCTTGSRPCCRNHVRNAAEL